MLELNSPKSILVKYRISVLLASQVAFQVLLYKNLSISQRFFILLHTLDRIFANNDF